MLYGWKASTTAQKEIQFNSAGIVGSDFFPSDVITKLCSKILELETRIKELENDKRC
jgi:hypothetical protein